jgi:hypothetical protein
VEERPAPGTTASGDRSVAAESVNAPVATGDHSLIITGDVSQVVQVSVPAALSAQSAYLEQVKQIAPAELHGRDAELGELAAFGREAGEGSYIWWQAPAWAGKSALMSWFALHPPPGVEVVSFFVTARFRGQDDRGAFTDVVLEQLAELLGEPLPGFLPQATREAHLLRMLSLAAQSCLRRGSQLVLVVDGLDEDRGVTAAPTAYSIAALLPARPCPGLRVIVAGRPDPPVPDDVPAGHPLRDTGIVRVLSKSPHAEVVREDMLRELKHLLHGNAAEQDLLGLVTAAGGGLAASDLAELTGLAPIDIEETLRSVAGRSFTTRPAQSRQRDPVYVLGHEELESAATRYLGGIRLAAYRNRLHAWADGYRSGGWAPETPEYLLHGYSRMLSDSADIPRIVAYAMDIARNDRMLAATGSDSAGITEIKRALDALLAAEDPDVVSAAVLAAERYRLESRNLAVPEKLAAFWVRLGDVRHAEDLARTIFKRRQRAEAYAEMASALADTGNHPDAARAAHLAEETAALNVSPLSGEREDLGELAFTLAAVWGRVGRPERAESLAAAASDPEAKAKIFTAAGRGLAKSGHRGAQHLARQAAEVIRSSTRPESIADALSAAATILAASGRVDEAGGMAAEACDVARSIEYPAPRMRLLADAATALAAVGRTDDALRVAREVALAAHSAAERDHRPGMLMAAAKAMAAAERPEEAADLVREAAAAARESRYTVSRSLSLIDAARLLAAAGYRDEAAEVITEAVQPARLEKRLEWEVLLVTHGGLVLAELGRPDRAADLVRDTELTVRAISASPAWVDSSEWQHAPSRLTDIAMTLAAAEDRRGAVRIAREAENAMRRIIDPSPREHALRQVAEVLITERRYAEAERVAQAMTRPQDKTEVLLRAGRAMAAAGQHDAAVHAARSATHAADEVTNDAHHRVWACRSAAEILAASRSWDEAEEVAMTIPWRSDRSRALASIATALAAAGHREDAARLGRLAWHTAAETSGEYSLSAAAAALAAAGLADEAAHLAGDLKRAVRTSADPEHLPSALAAVAAALAASGHHEEAAGLALEVAKTLRFAGKNRTDALRICVRTLIKCGRLEEAENTALSILRRTGEAERPSRMNSPFSIDLAANLEENEYNKGLEEVANAFAAADRWDDFWRARQQLTSLWGWQKPEVVRVLADARRWGEAARAIGDIAEPGSQIRAMADLVRALATDGLRVEAARVAQTVRRAATLLEPQDQRGLAEAAVAQAAAGRWDDAEELMHGIADEESRATARIEMAGIAISDNAAGMQSQNQLLRRILTLLGPVLAESEWMRALPVIVRIEANPAVYERLLTDPTAA